MADVPVDGFWSVSVYNRDGYFDENPYDSYSVNDVTAVADDDGCASRSTFGPEPDGSPNFLYVKDGWNYVARMYRPRPSILDGTVELPGARGAALGPDRRPGRARGGPVRPAGGRRSPRAPAPRSSSMPAAVASASTPTSGVVRKSPVTPKNSRPL